MQMKETKLRVWDKDRCRFEYSEIGENDDCYGIFRVTTNKFGSVIEQYTGLKDKNGKMVYQGDIVQRTIPNRENYYELYEVVYDDSGAAFKLRMWAKIPFTRKMTHMDVYFDDVSLSGLEVIGNVHEHSGLLPYKVEE